MILSSFIIRPVYVRVRCLEENKVDITKKKDKPSVFGHTRRNVQRMIKCFSHIWLILKQNARKHVL